MITVRVEAELEAQTGNKVSRRPHIMHHGLLAIHSRSNNSKSSYDKLKRVWRGLTFVRLKFEFVYLSEKIRGKKQVFREAIFIEFAVTTDGQSYL